MTNISPKSSQRIVVGVDFAETGDYAAKQAVQLARYIPGTELHVTYVIVASPSLVREENNFAQLAAHLPLRLQELRDHFARICVPSEGESFSVETFFHVRVGDPAEALHQVAVDVDADLLVVGTRGRKGVEKLLLGSVAEQLVRKAHLPVLVARPKELDELPKSERPDPPRAGEDLSHHGLTDHMHLEFVPRSSHISGLY